MFYSSYFLVEVGGIGAAAEDSVGTVSAHASSPVREIVFLANGNARLGDAGSERAKEALEAEGFTIKQFRVTHSEQEFARHLASYLGGGEPVIAIGGGDGTQRMAAEMIAGTTSVMAVVPLGTGNAWAREIGMPVNAVQVAQSLATAEVKAIDIGTANGRGFVNVATMGLTALIVKNMPEWGKGKFGRLAYIPAVLRSIRELRPFKLHIRTEQGDHDVMALMFVAAAGRTHAGPFQVTLKASHDDGLLSLYALDATDRRGLFRFGLALLAGRHTHLQEVWSRETASAVITTRPAKHVIVDGEVVGVTPLVLSIRPRALRVLIPTSAGAEQV